MRETLKRAMVIAIMLGSMAIGYTIGNNLPTGPAYELPAVKAQSCDACSDTTASLSGSIELDGFVHVQWETDEELSANGFYRVLRFATSGRTDTPVVVATFGEQGSCSSAPHDVLDQPAAGTWYYSVRILTWANVQRCQADAAAVVVP